MLTRSSVHCAERIVATSSSYAFVWSSAQCASGYSSASSATTAPARALAPRGRATGEGYPRVVTTEALDPRRSRRVRSASRRDRRARRGRARSRRARRRSATRVARPRAARPRLGRLPASTTRAYVHVARARRRRDARELDASASSRRPTRATDAVTHDAARRGGRARRRARRRPRRVLGASARPTPTTPRSRPPGFEPDRDLYEMRVPLPVAGRPRSGRRASTVRTFEPGRDEADVARGQQPRVRRPPRTGRLDRRDAARAAWPSRGSTRRSSSSRSTPTAWPASTG